MSHIATPLLPNSNLLAKSPSPDTLNPNDPSAAASSDQGVLSGSQVLEFLQGEVGVVVYGCWEQGLAPRISIKKDLVLSQNRGTPI